MAVEKYSKNFKCLKSISKDYKQTSGKGKYSNAKEIGENAFITIFLRPRLTAALPSTAKRQ